MKIENAVLNEKLIKEIEVLQQEENLSITLYLESLSEAIDVMLETSEVVNDEESKRMLMAARNISALKGVLRNLKA